MIPKDTILKIVEAGTWAPSGDNCQPWRFTWDGQKLLLLNVPEGDTSLYNSRQRASLIAHGAVLENMDIAARSYGYSMCPTLFPVSQNASSKEEQSSLIAAIEFQECPREDDTLLPFITKRVTNRNPYKKRKTIDKEVIAALMSLPEETGIGELYLTGDNLPSPLTPEIPPSPPLQKGGCGALYAPLDKEGTPLSPPFPHSGGFAEAKKKGDTGGFSEQIKFLAKAVAIHDRMLFENENLHHFVFEHIRWSEKEGLQAKDGMPIKTMGLNPFQAMAFRLLGNWALVSSLNIFGLSHMLPFQSYKLCLGSSAMGLIQMPGATPEDFVLGGRLLQRVWLTATKHGLAFHPMTGITFLIQRLYLDRELGFSETHKRLLEKAWDYLQSVFPVNRSKGIIMLFRLGYASPPPAQAPRRTVKQVLDIDKNDYINYHINSHETNL
ncbi:MAG: nitroreductase family protein [Desulfovibrionales bacterium]|nr:nitroreductase family protein [Desulfovibrionales bacterium]